MIMFYKKVINNNKVERIVKFFDENNIDLRTIHIDECKEVISFEFRCYFMDFFVSVEYDISNNRYELETEILKVDRDNKDYTKIIKASGTGIVCLLETAKSIIDVEGYWNV